MERLLHPDLFSDLTVEGAIRFMELIGPSFEQRVEYDKALKFSLSDYNAILDRFDQIWKTSENLGPSARGCNKRI